MKLFHVLILVLLAGFFPYMPILHASENIEETHHCTGIHENSETPKEHSMESCIEIIKKIQRIPSFDFSSFDSLHLEIPFEQYFSLAVFQDTQGDFIYFHATDPPNLETPNLIGIVRIIS